MKFLPSLIVAFLGLVLGLGGRRLLAEPGQRDEVSDPQVSQPEVIQRSPVKGSSDTPQSLAALSPADLYPRLALWLLDASATEIQQYWESYLAGLDQSRALTELILVSWTRLDPEGVIAATKGTDFAGIAWTAWACTDPENSLAKVLANFRWENPEGPIQKVIRAIAKHHPAWLRDHLGILTRQPVMKKLAVRVLSQTPDLDHPREAIDFLRKHGHAVDGETLAAFATKNPLEAIQLAMELKGETKFSSYRNQPDDLIHSLAEEDPALLDEILPRVTSPEVKMGIQMKQFELLLKSDPLAAEAAVKALPAGWAKQDQLASLAEFYRESDPVKSRSIALKLLQEEGDPTRRSYDFIHENGMNSTLAPAPIGKALIDKLVATDPKLFMEEALASRNEENTVNHGVIADAWLEQDLKSYAEWVNGMKDDEIYEDSVSKISNRLIKDADYPEAMEWAETVTGNFHSFSSNVTLTYRHWYLADPEAAKTWRESSSHTTAQREKLDQLEN